MVRDANKAHWKEFNDHVTGTGNHQIVRTAQRAEIDAHSSTGQHFSGCLGGEINSSISLEGGLSLPQEARTLSLWSRICSVLTTFSAS